ncbi:hypothetical protein AR1Y2_2862 [Anaerostipes rhamnosivorans]|uniref:Uncharacterized protein n=1 Tax=Anaerostipes rhamnosivorans TaxID=1229621 RepID=A0A4P8IG12_9FIRM|nr:hypothetical protein AR1Y2_2862 [Anaerostipes rhamnosivorans]
MPVGLFCSIGRFGELSYGTKKELIPPYLLRENQFFTVSF